MTKNKHDHTATKKIKAWLFAIMLLLPFLFLLPTGLYYGLNQNAQLSERVEQTPVYYQTNEISNISDINVDNIYKFNGLTSTSPYNTYKIFMYLNTELVLEQFNYNLPNANRSRFVQASNGILVLEILNDTTQLTTVIITNQIFNFIPTQIPNPNDIYFANDIIETNYLYVKDYTPTTTTNDISTSIINAWNSTWQNPLFSWTNYSPFYAPMQSFTNVFGINDMQIANILTYLATITAIYIVFDIVIELFTYLTHLIPRSD